jgi:hypothetical protein
MRIIKLAALVALTALSSLLALADPHINGVMTANAGTRFTLAGPDAEGVFTHTVNGVAQVSVIGNCIVHFDVVAEIDPSTGSFGPIEGTAYFLFPKDGSILNLKVKGSVAFEPGTPFGNFHYDTEVLSGTGQFAGARGKGEINGAAMFIDDQGNGTATWTYRGQIFTRPAK